MYPPNEPRPPCRSCKLSPALDTEVRCKKCHKAFKLWLDGGYTPQWNGVVAMPPDADEPRSTLDRAMAQRHDDE